jgi:hypothetical protein
MKRIRAVILLFVTLPLLAGCIAFGRRVDRKIAGTNPYQKPPFYSRYLHPESALDRQVQLKLDALRQNPDSARLHNDLGALLAAKGFPKDAELEYVRAIHSDPKFYPAWYNLGLIREARGDQAGAVRAFRHTLDLKPGHPSALFEMGLTEEKRGHTRRALAYYQKAFAINHALLDIHYNPRILDTRLVDLALLGLYPNAHDRRSIQYSATPVDLRAHAVEEAPSPQAPASNIVTPSAPVTEPATQTPPPAEPSEAVPAPPPGPPVIRSSSSSEPETQMPEVPEQPSNVAQPAPSSGPMQSVPSNPPSGNRRRRPKPPPEPQTPPPG